MKTAKCERIPELCVTLVRGFRCNFAVENTYQHINVSTYQPINLVAHLRRRLHFIVALQGEPNSVDCCVRNCRAAYLLKRLMNLIDRQAVMK